MKEGLIITGDTTEETEQDGVAIKNAAAVQVVAEIAKRDWAQHFQSLVQGWRINE